jgi:hypothetical protein
VGTATNLLSDPGLLVRFIIGGREGLHRECTRRLSGVNRSELQSYYTQLSMNEHFVEYTRKNLLGERPFGEIGRPADLYALCRSIRPMVVVETGVAHGVSSLYILQALEDNGVGSLYSIDLPNADPAYCSGDIYTTIPEGKDVGWLVPKSLRNRWTLLLGSSSLLLTPLLERVEKVDIFIHDSEHSYENMMAEFRSAWPKIREGGLLMSHDVNLKVTKGAFFRFAESVGRSPAKLFSGLGAIRK